MSVEFKPKLAKNLIWAVPDAALTVVHGVVQRVPIDLAAGWGDTFEGLAPLTTLWNLAEPANPRIVACVVNTKTQDILVYAEGERPVALPSRVFTDIGLACHVIQFSQGEPECLPPPSHPQAPTPTETAC